MAIQDGSAQFEKREIASREWVNAKIVPIFISGSHEFTSTNFEQVNTVTIPANAIFFITAREFFNNGKPTGVAISYSDAANASAIMENQSTNTSSATLTGSVTQETTFKIYARHARSGVTNDHSIMGGYILVD